MAERTYTSAIDRLAALPDVFTGGDLTVRFGWKSAHASSYLAHWRKAGLIQSLGGRADVHMNRVTNRHVNPQAALRRAFPSAIKVGMDILREAGWTTQIPNLIEVAVMRSSCLHQLQGFELTTRTDAWFAVVAPGVQRVPTGIDQLKPAWALADMLARANDRRVRKAWLPDPEDLDLNSVRTDRQTTIALAAFGLPQGSVDDAGYEQLYDRFTKAERKHPFTSKTRSPGSRAPRA